ncbi:MAG: ankyrin repeat domain-containing protein [Thermoguttaceae bacterium]|nr:ankyrin repeat domain-containing protein [Thermoguttaceae bacterium]
MRFSDYLTVSEGLKACEFFKLFFARGVDVNHQDKRGLALLQWVALLGAEDLVQFLLEQGADPNLVDDMSRTALEETIDSFDRRHPTPDPFKRGGCLAIIPALLRAGADPFRPYPNVDEIATNKRFQWNLDMRTNCQLYENVYVLVYKRAQEAYEHGFISSLEEYDKYRIFTETLKEMGKL